MMALSGNQDSAFPKSQDTFLQKEVPLAGEVIQSFPKKVVVVVQAKL